ncbi:MAG: AraC family transcriptional regulator [Spirochaetota bacterium]
MVEMHFEFPRKDYPRLTHFGYESGGATSYPVPHYHYGYELFYFTGGSGAIQIEKRGEPIPVRTQDLLIIAPNAEHCFMAESNVLSYYWIGVQTGKKVVRARYSTVSHPRYSHHAFDPVRIIESIDAHLADMKGVLGDEKHACLRMSPRTAAIFEDIREELTENRLHAREIIYHRSAELLARVIRTAKAPMDETPIGRVKRHIEAHHAEAMPLTSLAKLADMHIAELCRRFKAETGTTIVQYMNRMRIDSAKRLLRSGKSVGETANTLGFGTIYYFSALFKRSVGVSPKAYVRSAQG